MAGEQALGTAEVKGGWRAKLVALYKDERHLAWLPTFAWQDLVSVAALVALFVYVHHVVDGLDTGGDAVSKWQFARQWSWGNDFHHAKWTHHMTRMGVNVVAWIVQKVRGADWRSYYLVPLLMGVAQVPLVHALARRVAGRFGALLAGLILIYLPAVHTSVSQLLPDLFVGTYALLATYLLTRFHESRQGPLPLLLAAALVAFVGYLAKETFFFFYPGLALAAWLSRRRLRDVVIFAAVLLSGLLLETLAYSVFTDYPTRLSIVRSVHFAGVDPDEPAEVSAAGFLQIFRHLDAPWHYLLVAAAVGAIGLSLWNSKSRVVGQTCVAVGASHIVLLGFASQVWQNPLPRYMIPAAPFAAICASFVVTGCARSVARLMLQVSPRANGIQRYFQWLAPPAASAAIAVVATSSAWLLTREARRKDPPFDGRVQSKLVAELATDTYERNLPLVTNTRRAKPLIAVYDVYLTPRALARGGVLPNLEDVVKLRRPRQSYLVKDPSVYNDEVFDALQTRKCVLDVRKKNGYRGIPSYADVVQRSPLPARCDALLARLTRRAP